MPHTIGKIVTYIQEDGARIDAVEPANVALLVNGAFQWDSSKVPRFIGHAAVAVQDPATGRVSGATPLQFPIEADDIEQAFERFQDSLQAYGKKVQEQQSRIHTPPSSLGPM